MKNSFRITCYLFLMFLLASCEQSFVLVGMASQFHKNSFRQTSDDNKSISEKLDSQTPREKSYCDSAGYMLQDEPAIFGGQNIDARSWLARSTFLIVAQIGQAKDSSNLLQEYLCTGVLIERDVILTAAHCVSKVRSVFADKLKIVANARPSCVYEKGEIQSFYLKAKELRIHPLYLNKDFLSKRREKADIALIKLSEPLPDYYRPLKLAQKFYDYNQQTFVTAGFGLDGQDSEGSYEQGVRLRLAFLKTIDAQQRERAKSYFRKYIWGVLPDRDLKIAMTTFDNKEENELFFADQSSGAGICSGDSGGPALLKNKSDKLEVVGISSFIFNPLANSDKTKCAYVSAFTSTLYYHAWLREQIAQMQDGFNWENPSNPEGQQGNQAATK